MKTTAALLLATLFATQFATTAAFADEVAAGDPPPPR